jgi:hypothetical protein
MRATARAMLVLSLVLLSSSGEAQKFYPDDPLQVDNDKHDVPEQPAEIELSDMYDRLGHMFKDWGQSAIGSEAVSVNTLDEVPDSSWFTNRHGTRRMDIDELARGPNLGNGPDASETWTVFRSKSQGLTPGFQIYDEQDERYIIKLDPVEIPEIASAAEVIATKLFYAIGYNAPENYIVRVNPERFTIEPGTQIEDSFGDKMELTEWRFRRSIRLVPLLEDGSMRVIASKYLPGLPLGPFRYYETRSDDPNDVIRHEDRRELRGLRLFAAWLNHDDTRAQNTQDSWVEDNGKHYVRHYLLDYGSSFGSGSVDMQKAYLTFTYTVDFREMRRNLFGFGFRVPEYRHAQWPDFPEYEAVGRWEGELFQCEGWRNDYPNPAFMRMTARDAFWAAKIMMRFTPEELEAIVATGEYTNPNHPVYFLKVLIERQQKCGRFGINAINPIDDFHLDAGALEFTNLSAKYGFVEATTRYNVAWSTYDAATDERRALSEPRTQSETRVPLPDGDGKFLLAEIRSMNEDYPHWGTIVGVYLRPKGSTYEIVGIERESPETSTFPMN